MPINKNARFFLAILFAFSLHALFLAMEFHWQSAELQLLNQPVKSMKVFLIKNEKSSIQSQTPPVEVPVSPSFERSAVSVSKPQPLPSPVLQEDRVEKTNTNLPVSSSARQAEEKQNSEVPSETLAEVPSIASVSEAPAEKDDIVPDTDRVDLSSQTSVSPEILEEIGQIVKAAPLYKENPPPGYPGLAKKRGYEGTVLLDVFVLSDGKVGDVTVVTSSGYQILDRAAVKAVEGWLFSPALRNGRPLDMRVQVPVRFELR